ncbi:hypothetical protein PMIN01_13417 [Paraphaeosphaeria minitans]|uniref:Myb-like domain-containing protein n=1 Tax=Paraphaeosphaeria minitans TaxID=565426 RepID=A0A9P6KJN3_9PLEO|nr:hypothetical protein PMIN01_13417 [Paraphaeosphaeria minitans]
MERNRNMLGDPKAESASGIGDQRRHLMVDNAEGSPSEDASAQNTIGDSAPVLRKSEVIDLIDSDDEPSEAGEYDGPQVAVSDIQADAECLDETRRPASPRESRFRGIVNGIDMDSNSDSDPVNAYEEDAGKYIRSRAWKRKGTDVIEIRAGNESDESSDDEEGEERSAYCLQRIRSSNASQKVYNSAANKSLMLSPLGSAIQAEDDVSLTDTSISSSDQVLQKPSKRQPAPSQKKYLQLGVPATRSALHDNSIGSSSEGDIDENNQSGNRIDSQWEPQTATPQTEYTHEDIYKATTQRGAMADNPGMFSISHAVNLLKRGMGQDVKLERITIHQYTTDTRCLLGVLQGKAERSTAILPRDYASSPDPLGDGDDNSQNESGEANISDVAEKHGTAWSTTEDTLLRRLKQEGLPWGEIMERFLGRSPGAVQTRWIQSCEA